MMNTVKPHSDQDVVVERSKPKLKRPPRYQVLLLNDDYTPMEFVVLILQQFFAHNHERATQIMLQIHTAGKGVCGIFSREIAETKVIQVNRFAQQNQHPLKCTMEKVE